MEKFKLPKAPPANMLRVEPFKGLNLSVTPTQLDNSRSPDMLNMLLDERGSLNKRTGYTRAFTTSLGVGGINGLFTYHKKDGTRKHLLAHATQLYTWDKGVQPTSIYTGLADSKVHFFTLGDKCYIMDGTNYLVYDGATVSQVDPYIPTLTISNNPDGGGTSHEDFNLLGRGFKETYSGNGTATVYQLSLKGLDADAVLVTVDNVSKTEGTDFSVDRTNGTVTFTTAPSTGTNNVEITAYKTFVGFSDRINKSTFSVLFGGSNDTRVFVSGNPDYPNFIRRSGLYDPSYWPENGFYKVGSDSEKIQGFSKQYDYLVIEKERSKWNMQYQLNNGEPSFPIKPINDQVGTKARGSIQIIENNPVSLSDDGVYLLMSSQVRDERNVVHISENVDAKLLKEPNLDKAVSIDYDRKYWLALNGNVYIYDYTLGEWYLYNNINASRFIEIDNYLYFGSNTDGLVYYFKRDSDPFPYNDDGVAINAYWKSKHIMFDNPSSTKLVNKIFLGMKPNTHTAVDVSVRTDKKGEKHLFSQRLDQFDFTDFDFSRFGFLTSDFPQENGKKTKIKKITSLQIKLENNTLNESLGVLSLEVRYSFQSEVK